MKKYLYPLILLAFLALLPMAVKSDYFLHLMILFLMWVVIGSSWNILAGYTGQVSFGHAAFFGVGAYTAGLLFQHLQVSPWRRSPSARGCGTSRRSRRSSPAEWWGS